MLTNYHTHTAFCDGKNTAEEMVLSAIEKGFSAIGLSGHGYTPYDLRYCMKDTAGYLAEARRLQEKYKKRIQVYVGVEEDSYSLLNRADYDYIIGSSHYVSVGGQCYPFDSNYSYYEKALALFQEDTAAFAESYYQNFCRYIRARKPDIIGHFDLVTKFDETQVDRFLHDEKYWKTAEKYMVEALKADCIFEVNTGLMTRGFRSLPCPHERLLYLIRKNDGKVTLSSDAHQAETLDFGFAEVKKLLKELGFTETFVLYDGKWQKTTI